MLKLRMQPLYIERKKMLIVNNSILSQYERCERLYEWRNFHPKSENIHLGAGKALARAFEVSRRHYHYTHNSEQAENLGLLEIIDSFDGIEDSENKKSLSHVMFAFKRSNATFPLSEFHPYAPQGKPLIEFSFAHPLPIEFDNEPIIYSGAFDAVRMYDGLLCGHDDKSSLYIGPKWPEQWPLRGQFIGDGWGARQYGINLDAFIIRGVPIGGTNFPQETIIYTPQYLIGEWLEKTIVLTKRLISSIQNNKFYPALGDACNAFGGCTFRNICNMNKENRRENLERNFDLYEIDPITKERK